MDLDSLQILLNQNLRKNYLTKIYFFRALLLFMNSDLKLLKAMITYLCLFSSMQPNSKSIIHYLAVNGDKRSLQNNITVNRFKNQLDVALVVETLKYAVHMKMTNFNTNVYMTEKTSLNQ